MAYYNNSYYGYYPGVYPNVQPTMYPQQQMVEQPQVAQQPSVPQQTLVTQQTLVPPQNSDSFFVWVQGEAGAKSYPVARGTTMPLFDSEGDFVYFKTVDNNGIPLPLITKVLSDPEPLVNESKINSTDQYVTKDVYDNLVKKYSDLEERILELETKPTSSVTSNFTGNTFNNSRKGE